MRTVTEYLEQDHRGLDALFAEVERAAAQGDFSSASKTLRAFEARLCLHIDREEGVLFPTFDRITNFPHGPTRLMRAEHVELKRLMEEMAGALAASRPHAFARFADEFKGTLAQHNEREEQVLYPQTDSFFDEAGRDALVAELEKIQPR